MGGWTRVAAVGMAVALLAALAVSGIAGAEKGQKVVAGPVEVEFNGGFRPKALSRKKPTPIKFFLSGKIAKTGGGHPPALREFNVETDRNGSIQTKGYPVCKPGRIQATNTRRALEACRKALVGRGTATAEIELLGQNPVLAKSALLVFNGGTRGGRTTLYVHAYISIPVPAAIVTTVKIRKVRRGRYGLEAISKIPPIAGGAGSVKFFKLTIDKKYRYRGRRVSVLTAKCRDGKLQARGEAVFEEGTRAKAEVLRTCRPKR